MDISTRRIEEIIRRTGKVSGATVNVTTMVAASPQAAQALVNGK